VQGHLLLTNCLDEEVTLGIGTEIAAAVGLLVMFRRRGWM
jgi:hypothetical protein